LWTGVVAFTGAFYSVIAIIAENTSPQSFNQGTIAPGQPLSEFILFAVLTVVGSLIIFSWIDSTIEVALDLDFLHRDSVGWRRLRKFAWAAVVVGAFGTGLSTVLWEYLIFAFALGVPVAYSGVVLIVSGLRVQYGPMKAYMRWVGLLVLALTFELITAAISFYLNFPLLIFAYFLYRASTSLSKNRSKLVEATSLSTGNPVN
jgi:hypothetical protein